MHIKNTQNPSVNVVMVGGGVIGTSTAVLIQRRLSELLANLPSVGDHEKKLPFTQITVIDPNREVGRGMPYGPASRAPSMRDVFLNNQPNSAMDFDVKRPDGFCQFLKVRDPSVKETDFASRASYGDYVHQAFVEAQAACKKEALPLELLHVRGVVTEICSQDSAFLVAMQPVSAYGNQEQKIMSASWVFCADGHQNSNHLASITQTSGYFSTPLCIDSMAARLNHVPGDVLIVGSSQSHLDALAVLDRIGFAGQVYAVSRRTVLPWPFDVNAHSEAMTPAIRDWKPALFSTDGLLKRQDWSEKSLVNDLNTELAQAKNHGIGEGVVLSKVLALDFGYYAKYADHSALRAFKSYAQALYSNPTPPERFAMMNRWLHSGQLHHLKGDVSPASIKPIVGGSDGYVVEGINGLEGRVFSAVLDGASLARTALKPDGRAYSRVLQHLLDQDVLLRSDQDPRVFKAGPQRIPNLVVCNGPATNSMKWGMETFREGNSRIAEHFCKVVFETALHG